MDNNRNYIWITQDKGIVYDLYDTERHRERGRNKICPNAGNL